MQKPTDPIDPLLDRWNKTPPTPSGLNAEVWRRIAVLENSEESLGFWERLEAVFARPSFAFIFIAACTLAGLFFAEVRLSKLHADRNALYAKTYLQLIDPLVSNAPQAKTVAASDKS